MAPVRPIGNVQRRRPHLVPPFPATPGCRAVPGAAAAVAPRAQRLERRYARAGGSGIAITSRGISTWCGHDPSTAARRRARSPPGDRTVGTCLAPAAFVDPQVVWRTEDASSRLAIVGDVPYLGALRREWRWQVPLAGGFAGRPAAACG
jgi:hypothetical protein